MKTNSILNSLPAEVQEKVIETLKWFTGCFIEFANGSYKVGTCGGVQDTYPKDFKFIGYLKNTDIYTNDEIDAYARQM